MKKIITFMLMFNNFTPAFGYSPESASREENEDYRQSILRYLSSSVELSSLRTTPLNSAKKLSEINLPKVVAWKSEIVLQERFAEARDMRFLSSSISGEFPRRISWLFPDDGCFSRAALLSRNFFRMFVPIPQKIFVFGNLRVATPYSPKGSVSWWYHTASIVEVNNEKFVLDPSIEMKSPLRLNQWLERMGDPAEMKLAICESGTYSPSSDCSSNSDGLELNGIDAQEYYLNLEWKRVEALGLDPETTLGDVPPWY